MPRPPHKTSPLLMFRTYKPHAGGFMISLRIWRIDWYLKSQWNPYWLQFKPHRFDFRPQRTRLGAQVSLQLWRLVLLGRVILREHRPLPMRKHVADMDVHRVLTLAAHAFGNRQFSPKSEFGSLTKEEKVLLFWDAARQYVRPQAENEALIAEIQATGEDEAQSMIRLGSMLLCLHWLK